MTPALKQRVADLFDEVVELDLSERGAFLDKECADSTIRAEVESMLQHYANAEGAGFLNEPAIGEGRGLDAAHLHETLRRTPNLPGYEILGELARGGMGVVYKARHERLNRLVAIKMILSGEYAAPDLRQRFHAEAEAVAQLQHPNIVQIYEVGEHQRQSYLSLEYVDGESLKDKLAGTPLPAREAAELLETLARAIHFAHQRGIVHRDLKPSNILLQGSGIRDQRSGIRKTLASESLIPDPKSLIPKITDFGLAKRLEVDIGQTRTQMVMGTPSYMAPEQAGGHTKQTGPATDVYGLGAILYECLTGRPPFQGATPLDTLEQMRSQEPVPPRRLQPRVSRDLDTICLKCLQKEPQQRYLSAEALAEDLRRFLHGEPIQSRPVGLTERAWRWCRRKPLAASLVAAIGLFMLLASLGGWHFYVQAAQQPAVQHSGSLVTQLMDAKISYVPTIVEELSGYRRWADPRLRQVLQQSESAQERMRARLALLPTDPSLANELQEDLLQAGPDDYSVILTALAPHRSRLNEQLWEIVFDRQSGRDRQFRAAIVLANFDNENPRWPKILAEFIVDADAKQFAQLQPVIELHRERVIELMTQHLEESGEPATDGGQNITPERRASAAAILLGLGHDDQVWPLLRHSDDPDLRTFLMHRISSLDAKPEALATRLDQESDASARRALLLALGEFSKDGLAADVQQSTIVRVQEFYHDDPDPGVHSAAEYLLRRWSPPAFRKQSEEVISSQPVGSRRWYVNRRGHTLAIIDGPVEFSMGSPDSERDRAAHEVLHRKRIPRSFAIATTEVSNNQFRQFWNSTFDPKPESRSSPDMDGPELRVTWFEAAMYCQWLSEKEQIPSDQWCYPPLAEMIQNREHLNLPDDYLRRIGYRLPTEAEWEYACRGGAVTSRPFGNSEKVLGNYAWYQSNSENHAWPAGSLKPNDYGLFDMLGNAWEWCQDREARHPAVMQAIEVCDDTEDAKQVTVEDARVMRGGAFDSPASLLRSAFRRGEKPTGRGKTYGLRVARTIRESDVAEQFERTSKLWADEADDEAKMGKWYRATKGYRAAINAGADNVSVWYRLALVQLRRDAMEEFRETCRSLLGRSDLTIRPGPGNLAAWTCVLAPNAVDDLGQVLQLAQDAVASKPLAWDYHNTLGAVYYRLGRFQDAINELRLAEQYAGGSQRFQNCVFLAMAYQRLGDEQEAEQWLQAIPGSDVEMEWTERVELQLLKKEAQAQVEGNER